MVCPLEGEGSAVRQNDSTSIGGHNTHFPIVKQGTFKVLGVLLGLEGPIDSITIPFRIANYQQHVPFGFWEVEVAVIFVQLYHDESITT